jgi:hypothetical protein
MSGEIEQLKHQTQVEALMRAQVAATLAAAVITSQQSAHGPEDARRVYAECHKLLWPR